MTRCSFLGLALCSVGVATASCDQSSLPPAQPFVPATTAVVDAGAATRIVTIARPAADGGPGVAEARYETRYRDPVLEELRQRDEDGDQKDGERTREIERQVGAEKEQRRLAEKDLRSSLPEAERPASLAAFKQVSHLPPAAQYRTGTCWAFATTSFLESEAQRLSGEAVPLSPMATVYWEYVAKARRYLERRGDSAFVEGSEPNAVTRMWQRHGAWPLAAYPGVVGPDQRHDHTRLVRELQAVLESMKARNIWDEATVLGMLQVVLDRELGRPPERFEFAGRTRTPLDFMTEQLHVRPDDYVSFMSTLAIPFYTRGELAVTDNWWHDASYHNLPLDDFYRALAEAIRGGYGLVVAIDVSEPGKDPDSSVMFVPDYDIPPGRIDQLAREYRIFNHATTDDHGVHLVGYGAHAGHDWFLVKDSGRSALRGKHPGYYFVRDDYIKLKVLAFLVHKDAVAPWLAKFAAAR